MSGNTERVNLWAVVAAVLVALAALICLDITLNIWITLERHQSIWPFPALYLCEVVVLTAGAAVVTGLNKPVAATLTWIATGALLGFIALALMSIGSYYLPVVLLMALAGIVHMYQNNRSFTRFVSWSAGGAAAQIALMLGILSLFA